LLFTCNNYAAVCLVDVTQFVDGTINPVASLVDCDCYNRNGAGSVVGGGTCFDVADNNDNYALGTHEFQGGASSLLGGTLGTAQNGRTYVVQFITGQKTDVGCTNASFPRADVGALVDNFNNIETVETFEICDGTLTGEINAYLTNFLPGQFAGQFNKIDDNVAGGDAIMINFADEYLPNYRTLGAFVTAEVGIVDDFEDFQSCGDVEACFLRLGIDDSIGISDEFPTPTSSTGPPTSVPPTTITPPPPTTNPPTNRGGGGSCAIAGSPVQLGTAFANVLIPLVPVAFAFGVRAARRRRNK
jgi:hypothetical protein